MAGPYRLSINPCGVGIVTVHAPNKPAAKSPVKPRSPAGPARSVLPVHDSSDRGRTKVLRDELAAVANKVQYPRERMLGIIPFASTITVLLYAVLSLIFSVSIARAAECAGVRMPDTIAVKGTTLVLNGMGERTATIFSVSVYVAGLYLATPTRSAKEVLSKTTAKRMVLHFVRDVDRSDMGDAIEEGVRKNGGDKAHRVHKQIKNFTRRMPPLKKGMNLIFAYFPGSGLDIWADNVHVITFNDEQVSELLFRVWFGREPPDDELKAGMLGAHCD